MTSDLRKLLDWVDHHREAIDYHGATVVAVVFFYLPLAVSSIIIAVGLWRSL